MKVWFNNVIPHQDIREGHLDESVFAANLAEVASGTGRDIYTNPNTFFAKTYITQGIKNIAGRVISGLNGGSDTANRVISLQTGFGGGKTHTLISLYHIAKAGASLTQYPQVSSLLQVTGAPNFSSAAVAVFTNTTNDPVQGRETEVGTIYTLWGEIAYQLGGSDAYNIVKENDRLRIAPKGLMKKVLERCAPALILIDELADYCISAAGVKVGDTTLTDQIVTFMQELTEAVTEVDKAVLIATLPQSKQELAESPIADRILSTLENRIGRIGGNIHPVAEDEIFEVVRRRLFESIGDEETIREVAEEYSNTYKSHLAEVPSFATGAEYQMLLKKSYPFHPGLINIFRLGWAVNQRFQRTRGVLRILASVVSDLWRRRLSLGGANYLIHASDIVLTNVEAITSQISILYGSAWDAVIAADVSGNNSHAGQIDSGNRTPGSEQIAAEIAVTLLLETFGKAAQNRGLSVADIKLHLLKPGGFNHNEINTVLDKLEACAYYLYYSSSGGKRYWFEITPNVNILVNQTVADIKVDEVHAEIMQRLKEKTSGIRKFTILINPGDIPEQTNPALIILNPGCQIQAGKANKAAQEIIKKLAMFKGESPRLYRNTLLFLVCSETALIKLQSDVRNYIACKRVNDEYSGQLNAEQKTELKKRIEDSSKQSEYSLSTAFSCVVKHTAKDGLRILALKEFRNSIADQIIEVIPNALHTEEWILETVGYNTLQRNNLLPAEESVVQTKTIYEAFLRFDDKPMILNKEAVNTSLLTYCNNGQFAIASGDGIVFTRYYYKEKPSGFDCADATYWLVAPTRVPAPVSAPAEVKNPEPGGSITGSGAGIVTESPQPTGTVGQPGRTINSITAKGKVSIENYSELFRSFVSPFTGTGQKLEIEVSFRVISTETNPLSTSQQQYKSFKESAKQLNLRFEEE